MGAADDLLHHAAVTMPPDQYAELRVALDAGWRIEVATRKIAARYRDLDLANAVPRVIIYLDLGVLMGRIQALEQALIDLGAQLVDEDEH
jgi:hypothetical protein